MAERQLNGTETLLSERLVPLRTVCIVMGLSRSTVYRMIAADAFPKPVKISRARVAWREREVQAWLASLDGVIPPAAREVRHERV